MTVALIIAAAFFAAATTSSAMRDTPIRGDAVRQQRHTTNVLLIITLGALAGALIVYALEALTS